MALRLIEQQLLRTMLGADSSHPGFRNRYYVSVLSPHYQTLNRMVREGLVMVVSKTETSSGGVIVKFAATREGCLAAGLTEEQTKGALEG